MPKKAIQNQLVKESNAVARAKIEPKTDSVWEERIISILLAKVRVDDKIFHEQMIPFEELNAGREMSTVEHREAVKAVKNLLGKAYIIPYSSRGFEGWPIFKHIKIDDDGNIEARFNPDLCEHFLDLRKQFAIRSLPEFRELSGTYAQQLFRFLNSWKGAAEVTIGVDELHEFLSTPPSMRKNFKEFRTRVLELAYKEISEKTSLYYTWEPIRKGLRKVESIRFSFRPAAALAEVTASTTKKKKKAIDDVSELQRASNQCYEELQRIGKACEPKRTTKRCQFCMTRGRMYALKLIEKNQMKLPLEDLI